MSALFIFIVGMAMPSQIPSTLKEDEFSQKQKRATRLRLAEDKVRVRYLRREEVSLLEGIRTLDKDLGAGRKRLLLLKRRKKSLTLEKKTAQKSLMEQTEVVESLKVEVRDRLKAIHRLKRKPVLDLVLDGATDLTQRANLRRRLKHYLGVIFKYDAGLIKELHQRVQDMKSLNVSLDDQEDAILRNQLGIQESIESQLLLQAERSALLKGVRKERKLVERLRSEIARAAKQAEREARITRGLIPSPPALAGGFRAQKGRLVWPVAGRVEVPFGKRVDPDSGLVMVHKGIDVRAPHGVTVRAVFSGTVRFAGRLDGYGELVIVDHGGQWHSVYGHLSGVRVRVGQKISRTKILGNVSDLDSRKGSYLYFELRNNKRAVDPLDWMSPG